MKICHVVTTHFSIMAHTSFRIRLPPTRFSKIKGGMTRYFIHTKHEIAESLNRQTSIISIGYQSLSTE